MRISYKNLSIAVKSHPKYSFTSLTRTVKFLFRDKKTIEQLIKKVSIWNYSLDKMTSGLDQELSRRRPKTQLSTSDTNQLQQLEVAATMFEHPDLQRMASVRNVMEKGVQSARVTQHIYLHTLP